MRPMKNVRNYVNMTETTSTNALLKERIYKSSSPVFDVVTADKQTSGRGRLGRSFFSPSGGAYFSAAYPLSGKEKNIPFLTLLAGLAVSESIRELTGENTLIKWPNDIFLNGKKLCGILTELVTAQCGMHAVVGVGINLGVSAEEIPAELKDKMTSFAALGLPCPDRETLIKRAVEISDGYVYEKDLLNAVSDDILSALNESSFLFGKNAVYEGRNVVCGRINPDGSINVTSGGNTEKVFSGEIVL